MWNNIRRALVTAFAASVGLAGLSYAATGSLNPVTTVSDNEEVTVPTEVTPVVPTVDGTDEEPAEGTDGPERSTEGCGDGTFGNHGQFVSSQEDTPRNEAAHSPCGKPVQSIHTDDEGDETAEGSEAEEPKKDKGDEHGKPADHKPAEDEGEAEGS